MTPIWEDTEGLQLSQKSAHQNELYSDLCFWNAQNPCNCMLQISFRPVNLILVNPSGKQRSVSKQEEEK